MNFSVSKEAAQWYIEEMGLEQNDYVHFFVKIYGGNYNSTSKLLFRTIRWERWRC